MSSDAEEVAEDYRHALEDLSSNMRFEISNLTVIARENTEHALAIAEVLQQHILKAPPNKKLPALYVLDSIVKNVGTPYTLYFGRTLFKTFMESYAVVDNAIRKKMEEMLRTWKDPVPGSMDTRPVFSHELVRPIENALMKARAATMGQQGPLPGRPRSAIMPHRNTPTPPGMHGGNWPTGSHPQSGYPYPNGVTSSELAQSQGPYLGQQYQTNPFYTSQSTQPVNSSSGSGSSSAPFQASVSGLYGSVVVPNPAVISVETLSNDIQNLIIAMKIEFSQKPHDAGVQTRLRALLDLQGIVRDSSLPPEQLELIKNKVTELAAVTMRSASSQNSTPNPGLVPPQVRPPPTAPASVTPSPAPVAGPNQGPPLTLDSLFGQGAMAALLSRQQSSNSQTSTPNPPFAQSAIRSPPPTQTEPPKQCSSIGHNPLALLDQLRQAGLLPNPATTNSAAAIQPPPPPPPVSASSLLPPNIASLLAASKVDMNRAGLESTVFNPAALKQQFRPDLIASLYDDLGPPCTQCGRRFRTDVQGKNKKMAHMDWHFQVHQRSTEAEKKGTHRSWYVDQQDWLKSREVVDADQAATAAAEEASAQTSKAEEGPKYIPVPDPTSGVNNVCPICQDKFENKWLVAAQEWVWLDAVLVGNRAYHASCHAEATRDREGTPVPSKRTPEPILGKRKADSSLSSPKIRTMKTSV